MVNTKIVIGNLDTPDFTFENNAIESVICENAVSLTGGEMTADVLETSVFFNDENGVLRNVPYATSIWYLINEQVIGLFYCKSVKRIGINKYLIQASSLLGLLENEMFYGGMYNNAMFSDVLSDILYCDGISPKYKIYDAKSKPSSGKVYGANPSNIPWSATQWKYHLHAEFVLVNSNLYYPSSGEVYTYHSILGLELDGTATNRNGYDIQLSPHRFADGRDYWAVSARYNGNFISIGATIDEKFVLGNGSRVVVDIDPMGGKMHCVAYYKRGDNSEVTGVLTKDAEINYAERTDECQICCIFGPMVRYTAGTYSSTIGWIACDVYDENGAQVVCGCLAQDPNDSSKYYIANGVDGAMEQTNYFEPNGGEIGALTDISKYRVMRDIARTIEYNDGVAESRVFGWIPFTSRREALHQLLFSQNINLIKSGNGGIVFTPLANVMSGTIDDDNIYMGGREEELNQAKSVNVTEHSFSSVNLTSRVIFDNSQSDLVSGDYIAHFQNAPIYGEPVASSGITIKAYNCNLAIVSGRGIITGTPYIHSSAVIRKTNTSVIDGGDISVSDVNLITPANSDNIIKKLEAYYFKKISKITNGIKYGGEKCGNVYSIRSPYDERVTAFLTRVSSKSSSFTKSECEFISGYVPSKGSGYSNFAIVKVEESFVLPTSVFEQDTPTIRINIIGSGTDGENGEPGENGKTVDKTTNRYVEGGDGGVGGKGGKGGTGGKIYSITVNVSNVRSLLVKASGNEVIVNTRNNSGDVVNTYSSSSGLINANGFTNIFTGIVYALPGKNGLDGGRGGKGGHYIEENPGLVYGEAGESVGAHSGGTSPQDRIADWDGSSPVASDNSYRYYYFYGGGGGASGGNDGGNAYYTGVKIKDGGSGITMYAGNGADGGAPIEGSTTYGCGGNGGNGGGGGGGSGIFRTNYNFPPYPDDEFQGGEAGHGGAAGIGANGIEGCAIIYY